MMTTTRQRQTAEPAITIMLTNTAMTIIIIIINNFWKILSLLETTINCLWNKYNISRHFLKTLLHLRVKHKSLKMLQLLNQRR